ncbi:hypothetical protein C8P66_10323 [Humitalea rosea]|uniref:Uncharacterized protein n=1 Tax=Humitalea rosea TaxID=990373 RepID=A0A2W7KL14_9PROT|nr:hypothetical protein [Humitalea rosea]PZW48998.1 hypothetical protein C8P66_10323 [Humitalea rosea]
MRAKVLCLSLLIAAPVGAVGVSAGHEMLEQGVNQTTCLDRASQAVVSQGLRQLSRDSRAVWAENSEGDELYGVYCIAERGVVTVTGAAEQSQSAEAMVTRLRAAMRAGGTVRRK